MNRVCAAAAAVLITSGAASAAVIDFEGFSAGDRINSLNVGGVGVDVTVNSNGAHDVAMVFDTDNYTGGDNDLRSPFTSSSGAKSRPGNVLIISEDNDSSDPDDEARGGTITFTFDQMVTILGFDAFDDIRLTTTADTGASTSVRLASDRQFASVALNWVGVTSITFDLGRHSGAIDNIRFAPIPVPAAFPLMLGALGGLGFMARRRRKSA